MGKNKLNSRNPAKSRNPIYKKVGAGATLKTKNKAKQVKTNLKKLKITNKEAVASLDKQLEAFREAIQSNSKKVNSEHNVKADDKKSPVSVEETAESLSRL